MTVVAVTGHRPDKLGGYDHKTKATVNAYARHVVSSRRPERVITGMALGWDMAVANACASLKVPFVAAVPFIGHDRPWALDAREELASLLRAADAVEVLYKGSYQPWKLMRRNEWMVNHCDVLWSLWNGVKDGGTWRCVSYAESKGKSIVNLWPEWRASYAE